MSCTNSTNKPNGITKECGGVASHSGKGNLGSFAPVKSEWETEVEPYSTRYRLISNGRNTKVWVDKDRYNPSAKLLGRPYTLYTEGLSCAKRIGDFKYLKDAKEAAVVEQAKQAQIEEEKLNSISILSSSFLSDPEFNLLRNMYGNPISTEMRDRLNGFLRDPNQDTWNDVSSIILRSTPLLTVWQAVRLIAPGFPATGQVTDGEGKVIQNWKSIPTKKEFNAAIFYAAFHAEETNWNGESNFW